MTMEKENFEKMITEFQELNDKTTACRDFIMDKEKFEALDMINRDLLIAQLKAMEAYLSILSIRLGINGSVLETPEEEQAPTEEQPTVEENA